MPDSDDPHCNRVAIIGAGHVGSTAAFALMLRALFREIVLIDHDHALALAEAADLSDANALARPARIWAGNYADAACAQIAVITAGAATHGDEARLTVASNSAAIIRASVSRLMSAGFDGILLIASNPVDLMALIAHEQSGLPATRVIGTGTLLDSNRLKQRLAREIDVAPGAVDAIVLGEHGDSEVAAFSGVRIGGMPLAAFAPETAAKHEAIANDVRQAAYAIINGKGHTSFGIATAIVRICEAILRDERTVLPVSALLTGEYGISEVYLSLPCILGAGGIQRILQPELVPSEVLGLRASASMLRHARLNLDRHA
jgi:L-lactate dehydrogenase